MSNFEVLIEKISNVEHHPDADRLSIVTVRGYRCISAKLEDGSHRYKIGDRVVYIPEDAIVPDKLLKKGFWDNKNDKGMLAGNKGNRVKAIKLRGIVSQGILYSVDMFDEFNSEDHFCLTYEYPDMTFSVGDDVSELLDIKKYEPEIPESMSGKMFYAGSIFPKFDIENIKKYRELIEDYKDDIVITEKLHGTFMVAGYTKDRGFVVSSKGLSHKGMTFDLESEDNSSNVYLKIAEKYDLKNILISLYNYYKDNVFIMGEVYGKGIQDLQYSEQDKKFRAFDIFVGDSYLNYNEFKHEIVSHGLDRVPLLYEGPYSEEIVAQYTNGKSILDNVTVREGVVIKPKIEFYHQRYGRLILKSVSDDYLLRKNATEYQ
jgi:RNA ligase (TIGR02306 family)